MLKKNLNKQEIYDVVIIGGGLSGLTLARQLLLSNDKIKILILERRKHPAPEAAFKVGESTVEIGAHYLADRLNLKDYLKSRQLPKAGLRFFFSNKNNLDISQRTEFGAIDFPPVSSYQLDRGRFENDLCEMVISDGVDFIDLASVKKINLNNNHNNNNNSLHSIDYVIQDQAQDINQDKYNNIKTKWVIDASGRSALLKRKLGLQKEVDHNINASWFRVNKEIDISKWQAKKRSNQNQNQNQNQDYEKWKKRIPDHIRHLSTCHLMGKGYWVWIIPLASKATSIGIVADGDLYPHESIFTFDKSLVWLKKHEPQLAEIIESIKSDKMDFRTLKNYSHDIKQVYSSNRWAITGESGAFLDPFYSPGTDCIAISNDFIADLIIRDFKGEDISERVSRHNFLYLKIIESFFCIYQKQYPIMGNSKVMLTKISWDYASYWSGVGLLFFADKLTDVNFMKLILREFSHLAALNSEIQKIFRLWSHKANSTQESVFIDTLSLSFLYSLNSNLAKVTAGDVLERFRKNILFLQSLINVIKDHVQKTTDMKFDDIYYPCDNSIKSELNKIWDAYVIRSEKEKTTSV